MRIKPSKDQFVGKWVSWIRTMRSEQELFSDGRFEGVGFDEECQNRVVGRVKGTWEVVDDAIHWRYTEAKKVPLPKKVDINLIEHLDAYSFRVWENKRWKTSWFRAVQGEETSANFDSDQVQPLLRRIASNIDSGFSEREITEVMKKLRRLKPEQTYVVAFSIAYKGTVSPFRIRIFMDDVDAPDISFYAPVLLTRCIDDDIQKLEPLPDG